MGFSCRRSGSEIAYKLIADHLEWENGAEEVAALIDLWEGYTGKSFDYSDVGKAAKFLSNNREKIYNRYYNSNVTNWADNIKSLRRAYKGNHQTVIDRLNFIARLFSEKVDKLQEKYPERTREEIIRGFTDDQGNIHGGQFYFFNEIKMDIQYNYKAALEEGDIEYATHMELMLNNFPALIAYSRVVIRDREGIKLGNYMKYVETANEGNFGDNDIAELHNVEEATKEHWQEMNEYISSFGTLGKAVRRVLSNISLITQEQMDADAKEGYTEEDEGFGVELDDLGYPRTIDPIRAHQLLVEELTGMTDEEDMINTLRNSQHIAWAKHLANDLEEEDGDGNLKNPTLKTQFFVDMKKSFQLYKILIKKLKNGVLNLTSVIKNQVTNLLGDEYKRRISKGVVLNEEYSIYDKEGNVNWQNVAKLRDLINEWFSQEATQQGAFTVLSNSKFYSRGVTRSERAQVIKTILNALGIECSTDDALSLAFDRNGHKFIRHIKQLFNYTNSKGKKIVSGFNETSPKELGDLDNNLDPGSIKNFKNLLEKRGEKETHIGDVIDSLLDDVAAVQQGVRTESRIVHKDKNGKNNTMYSHVQPSYLGDFIGKIQRYVRTKDINGLRNFLDSKYGKSSMFKLDGEWLNTWIKDLYEDGIDAGGFAESIMFSRYLGSEDSDFENYTSKQDAISLLVNFSFGENTTDSENHAYAHYPTFVLGDSGVRKYIKAKVYSEEEIVEGLYNIYKSEIRRQKLIEKASQELVDAGLAKTKEEAIANISGTIDKFTILKVFNDPANQQRIEKARTSGLTADINKEAEEREIKQIIREDLQRGYEKNLKELRQLGVFEKNNSGKYKYLNKEVEQYGGEEAFVRKYYFNTRFATINQVQLMTIDPGFYLNTKDFQKRYKEIHAPGSALSTKARWYDGKLFSKDGIERVLYFDDIKLDSRSTNNELIETLRSAGLSEETLEAYYENTLTDGQGYRTLDSYRKVMGMAGKWTREMQYSYDLIKDLEKKLEGPITKEEEAELIQKIADEAVIFMPIKPYMFTHEKFNSGMSGDELLIPVQHKYAEAVLIPALLPKGSKLRDLALEMDTPDENGNTIDVVCATSCVKVGSFGAFNMKDVTDRTSLREAMSKAYKHQLNYEDYRIQTNVPEHINSSQLFGTQVRKLIMEGINMDSFYNYADNWDVISNDGNLINLGDGRMAKLNGRNLVNFYNALIVAQILDSYNEFKDLVTDPKKLSEAFIQNVLNNSRESWDNILAYTIEDGKFAIPLYEGSQEHDASAYLLSLFKKIVNKQRIAGGSLVQVSSMGISGYEEDKNLRFVEDHRGNIVYAEVEVPFDLTVNVEGKQVRLNYTDYCDNEGNLLLSEDGTTTKIEEDYPGILDRVCYRIPTERSYSMMRVKIKRFSKPSEGGTIKVPLEGTTRAGFDFDIDKLYFMMKEFHYEVKDGKKVQLKYNLNKSPLYQHDNPEVNRALRNNMLLDIIMSRLQDKETLKSRFTPGGFEGPKKAAKEERYLEYADASKFYDKSTGKVDINALEAYIAEKEKEDKYYDPEPNYDFDDPMTVIRFNQQNQIAGKLIGVFANQNANTAFSSLLSKFALKQGISFCGHTYSDMLHNANGVDTALQMAEYLAASVDAVKDPVLNYMNLNTVTATSASLLARLGYTHREISLLLNQPIIKELCNFIFNEGWHNTQNAIEEIRDKYERKLSGIKTKVVANAAVDFTAEQLAGSIVQDRLQRENANNDEDLEWSQDKIIQQLKVLQLFEEVNKNAVEVSEFVKNTKFTAANSVASTIGDMYEKQMAVKKYAEKTLNQKDSNLEVLATSQLHSPISYNDATEDIKDEDYLRKLTSETTGNPFAFEQAMLDMNVRMMKLINDKLFPYNRKVYRDIRELAYRLTGGRLDGDTINKLHSEFLVYALNNVEGSIFDSEALKDSVNGITNREWYLEKFPLEVATLLETYPDLKDRYTIFEFLNVSEGELRINNVGGLDATTKEQIRASWGMLYEDNPELARNLFAYCFYKSGFGFNSRSFMHLAPTSLKRDLMLSSTLSYIDFLNNIQDIGIDGNILEFYDQFVLNHTDNYRLVHNVKGKVKNILTGKAVVNDVIQNEFTVRKSELQGNNSLFSKEEGLPKNVTSFKPYIKLEINGKEIIYKASNSIGEDFNLSNDGSMRYIRVTPISSQNKGLGYWNEESRAESTRVKQKIERQKKEQERKEAEERNNIIGEKGHPMIDDNNSTDDGSTGELDESSGNPSAGNTNLTIEQIAERAVQLALKLGTVAAENANEKKTEIVESLREVSEKEIASTVQELLAREAEYIDQTGEKCC